MVGYEPKHLGEALVLLNMHKGATVFAGGTDLMVVKRFAETIVFINKLEELQQIQYDGDYLRLGAGLTYSQLINSDIPDILKEVFSQVASPAIRNRGTIGGNICNASPAGDTLPMWYGLHASVEIASADKQGIITRRHIPIEEFILGIRKINKKDNELLTAVLVPRAALDKSRFFYYKKVGARRSEAISKLSFFGTACIENGVLKEVEVAFGAVGITVVTSRNSYSLWEGLTRESLTEKQETIIADYMERIKPIDDQRSTAVYRKKVSENLFRDFIEQLKELM